MDCKDWQLVELVDKARNVREAKGNHFRRMTEEAIKKRTAEWLSQGAF